MRALAAGVAILLGNCEDKAIHPLGLLIAALPPRWRPCSDFACCECYWPCRN